MSVDWKRLRDLETIKEQQQFGQTLDITPSGSNPDLVSASKDLIRLVGEKWDVEAWRIYLGAWQPRAAIATSPLITAATYADPTPWAPPEPRTFDSMLDIAAYARIMWGAGMVQHHAYVDWPKRGCLLQVSASYVQVNAFVDTMLAPGTALSDQLPILKATAGPEPGGGDSSQPATFTYRPELGTINSVEVPEFYFRNFQIPPFARAFVPIVRMPVIEDNALTLNMATQILPLAIGATAGNDIQQWRTPDAAGVYDQEFVKDPFPIVGQQAGVLRIELSPFASVPLVGVRFGVMFLLDL